MPSSYRCVGEGTANTVRMCVSVSATVSVCEYAMQNLREYECEWECEWM